MIGADIGTQTVAYTSDTEVGLKNLSERGNSIQTSERKERLLYRAMDRSRRATNPQNYNEDGTIKKGRKTWKYSNHYKKLKTKHSELCRINAKTLFPIKLAFTIDRSFFDSSHKLACIFRFCDKYISKTS